MKLFDHQKLGIEFLKEKGKAILADEMGLGKTWQGIIAAKETKARGVLVVCPASLKINWLREIQALYPGDNQFIIDTKRKVLPKPLAGATGWYIINYDILGKMSDLITEAVLAGEIDTLILDEAHYIKGRSIRATAIIGGKVKKKDGSVLNFEGLASQMPRVYCLTGTPLLNRPIEMFNLLRAIGHPIAKSRDAFAKRYCGAFTMVQIIDTAMGRKFMVPQSVYYARYVSNPRYRTGIRFLDESGATNLEELRSLIGGVLLRRLKKDVLDLPDKITTVMDVELSPENKKLYDTAWDSYLDFIKNNPIPERNIDNVILARQLVEVQKLKQVCSLAKVPRIVSDIENAIEQGEKIIVFSQYTKTIEALAEGLGAAKIKYQTLTGADNTTARQKAIDTFETDPKCKVFVANIIAGGVGLNLTAASIVMFADMDWSPETHNQATDRAHRIGQTQMVNVYYYVCPDTIELDILQLLNEKSSTLNQVLGGTKDRLKTGSTAVEFLKRMG